MNALKSLALTSLLFGCLWSRSNAADFPRGFVIEDLRHNPPAPAFYNLDIHQIQPIAFRKTYSRFIDFAWDRDHGRLFFSARPSFKDPFQIYMKSWPDGEETVIYENSRGPFRFLLSPDGARLALQVMGASVWPYIGVLAWESKQWTALGQGYSPDWSTDGQRLLYLKIPGELPTWLYEYRVESDSSTVLIQEPVMEAVYTDDADQILLKTASQAKAADWFQLWNRRNGLSHDYCKPEKSDKRHPWSQRELTAFPGHQFFLFKEAPAGANPEAQILIVTDVWGRRLQELPRDDWDPEVQAVDITTLAMSEDPLIVRQADGTGRPLEIPQARFLHFAR